MILPKSKWPKYLTKFKEIRGISYGRCKDRCGNFENTDRRNSRQIAHAHCAPKINYYGWVCLRNKSLIKNRLMILHEVAHVLAGYKNGHNDVWRRSCLRIGGSIKSFKLGSKTTPDYTKKKRK